MRPLGRVPRFRGLSAINAWTWSQRLCSMIGIVLAGVRYALVHGLADIQAIVQDAIEVALLDWLALLVEGAFFRQRFDQLDCGGVPRAKRVNIDLTRWASCSLMISFRSLMS